MKKNFIKKLMNLLEKEVCHKENKATPSKYPLAQLKPFQLEKKQAPLPHLVSSQKLKAKETVLSEGVHVKGELQFKNLLRINGSFEGLLQAKGKVIIGPKGIVKGEIHLDEADIFGRVVGNIKVKKLSIHKNAEVTGDIQTSSLTIEDGAALLGHVHVSSEASTSIEENKELTQEYQFSG